MAVKSDFTEQEWDILQKGVTGAALLVSLADRSLFDTFKEVGALAKHLSEARGKSTSLLVRDLAGVRGTGFGLTSSPTQVESETIETLRSAMSILRSKAPDDAPAYRDFVLDVAQSVAKAAKGIEPAESEALDKIKAALETS
jgi:hypothetical protein